jgi:hypothetical protein
VGGAAEVVDARAAWGMIKVMGAARGASEVGDAGGEGVTRGLAV